MRDLPLLPSDRYIAELLGLSEDQYRYYMAEVRRRAAEAPQPSVTADAGTLAIISLVATVISIGLTIVASFFKPKSNNNSPGTITQNQLQGQVTTNIRRYTPRQGFDSLQDVAGIGTPIPLIYAKRELLSGSYYGGVRVNVPLIWSQLQARDKGQVLRALFMIGEGDSTFTIEPESTGIGNNTLGSYLLGGNEYARFTVYYRPNGGRITSTDRVAGSANDPSIVTTSDIYAVVNESGVAAPYFCHTRKPNTQTQFGVYSLIGNGLGFRVNPQLRPIVNANVTVDVKAGGGKKSSATAEGRIVCDRDFVAIAQREKMKAKFSGRGALTSNAGTTWTYLLSNTTDALTTFQASASAVTWSGEKALQVNPFPVLADATVLGWLSFGSITSNGGSVSGTVVFSTSAATNEINLKSGGDFVYAITDGSYIINYGIAFVGSDGKKLFFEHLVTVTVTNTTSGGVPVRVCSYTNTSVTYSGSVQTNESYQEKCGDAASAIAGRQKSWDDAIQVGELYKIGTALAVCTARTPSTEFFSSDADYEPVGGGTAVEATFQVVRSGAASTISAVDIVKDAKSTPPFYTATGYTHLFRVAIANVSTLRECRIVQIGIRSSLGIRINNLCNFRDSLTFTEIDNKACLSKEGQKINPGATVAVDIFNSGVMNSSEERYSFFRIRYREGGTDTAYTEFPQCFGIRGNTQQNIFNSLRFVMPSTKRWEFQIEPLSGWEIRSGNASGDLELIDSNLSTTRSITTGGVTITFRGAVNGGGAFIPAGSRASVGPTTFLLASVQRGASTEIGLGYSDGNSYVDPWGKLAEAFVYEEVTSSADSGPEHEIVFINEISPNPSTPEYDNLALLGLTMRSGSEWQQFGQLSVYVLSGLGNTHLFPEILKDLFTNTRYGKGDQITLEQIDTDSFTAATAWCSDRKLFFDGAITGKTNLRQWAADVAAAHLLLFGESSGKFWLKTAWPGTVSSPSAVTFKGIFNAGNIKEGSFSMDYFPPEDRRPVQVSVRYREERLSTNLANPGLFPTEREVLVREASPNGASTDPIESLDLSDYVTSRSHAIDAAKYLIRMRRIPSHAVKFETTHEGILAALGPGDYIRVAMDMTSVDTLRNGAVLGDGTLVTTQPFADGTYTVFAWDGSNPSGPTQQTLTVSNSGSNASPTGIIFTLVNSTTQVATYQIERISPVSEGGYSIEAVHMPTNGSNVPLIAEGFDTEANWVIEE